MYPVLAKFGPFTVFTYGLMLVISFLLAMWLLRRAASTWPKGIGALSPAQVTDWGSLVIFGGIIGGRLLFVVLHWEVFVRYPMEIPAIWHGGLVWYGGLIGGLLASFLYIRLNKLLFLPVLDQVIPYVVLGHAIGRIGCFFNGCCYGFPTHVWYGVTFPGVDMPLVPTQLIESISLLTITVILRRSQRTALIRYPGTVFAIYLLCYGLARFWIEYLRGDQVILWGGLTMQQFVSVGFFIYGVVLIATRFKLKQQSDAKNV